MGWSGRLGKLGFTLEQMVRCRTNSSALVFIPARVNEEPVQLVFSNGRTADCHLYQSYVTDRALPVPVATLSAFGRTIANPHVVVDGEYRQGDPPIAGHLYAKFFEDGIVAIDFSVPAMALASSRDRLSLAGAVSRLALDATRVTIDGKTFVIALDTTTAVTPEYLGEKQPGRNGRVDLTLLLPGGPAVTESVTVRPAKTKIDGVLGADLLCRWITVFDFPAGELLLFPYD
jgi:hypothetical protein